MLWATIFGVALSIWFALSAVTQFRTTWSDAVKSLDGIGLLPSWSFFAPNPARSNWHLVVRFQLESGTITPWREYVIPAAGIGRGIWNPRRREEKALSDVSSSIIRRKSRNRIQVSLPYVLLLNTVSGLEAPSFARCVQFAILSSTADYSAQVPNHEVLPLFLSDLHRVPSPSVRFS